MEVLGIDIGGSGIKGAPVNTETGELLAERFRIPTPQPSKPKAVAKTIATIAQHFAWHGFVGSGFPAVVQHGVAKTAANMHEKWIDTNAEKLFSKLVGGPVIVVNDADAAGLAEMRLGAGRGRHGVVIVITIGTGLGTAMFTDGHLVPNMEFGHLEIRGKDAETRASDAARKHKNLSWKKWAIAFDEYLHTLERMFWPDLIILGGGASKKTDLFLPYLTVQAEIAPAQLLNNAGIVGAALAAEISSSS